MGGGSRRHRDARRLASLVAFGDVPALVEAVMRFAESPTLRAGVGSAAREVVRRRFELKRLYADITRLYRELLADGRQP